MENKLREVSVSSFSQANNYTVAKEILVNQYGVKVKNSEQPLSENHATSQTNDSKYFRCNVAKMQEDFLRKFCTCVCYF